MKRMLTLFATLAVIISCSSSRKTTGSGLSKLDGSWKLFYISGPRIAFEGLFPDQKPLLIFSSGKYDHLGGNTGCNGFGCELKLGKDSFQVVEPITQTMMFCEGGGEKNFLNILRKIDRYTVTKDTLTLLTGDVAMMRFIKN